MPSSQRSSISDAAPQPRQGSVPTKSSRLISFLPVACCAFMIYSSVTAIVDSHGDPFTVFSIVSSFTVLGLLYLCMRQFERAVAEKDDVRRDRLKMAIWLPAMLLNILFSYLVTSVLQSPVMTGVAHQPGCRSRPTKSSRLASLLPAACCASTTVAIFLAVASAVSITSILYLVKKLERTTTNQAFFIIDRLKIAKCVIAIIFSLVCLVTIPK